VYAAAGRASPGALVGVDVVAGKVYRGCPSTRIHTKELFTQHESPRCERHLAIVLGSKPSRLYAANTSICNKSI
jgi:hypothetical protein